MNGSRLTEWLDGTHFSFIEQLNERLSKFAMKKPFLSVLLAKVEAYFEIAIPREIVTINAGGIAVNYDQHSVFFVQWQIIMFWNFSEIE